MTESNKQATARSGSTKMFWGALILGVVLGGIASPWVVGEFKDWWTQPPQTGQGENVEPDTSWPPPEFAEACEWTHLKVDEDGWSARSVFTYQNLDEYLSKPHDPRKEITIPIFPSVYEPRDVDKLYYDAILESDIRPGDKVLVIGTGSGADSWVASLKSQAPVYVVEVNPMAVANARATARLGGFEIRPVVGDIRNVELPPEYSDFDFVLWNMPWHTEGEVEIEEHNFHDGDEGDILERLLARLPSLLKKGGKAMLLNVHTATDYITSPGVTAVTNGSCVLFEVPNN
jgi:SAM-dependent methyltransferase